MELETLLNDPVLRRCWLLSKALEIGSLQDAVRLAQEADEFVVQGRDDTVTGAGKRDRLETEEPPRNGSSLFAGSPGAAADAPLHGDPAQEANGSSDDRVAAAPVDDEAAVSPNGHSSLAVLAGIEDIVRYLRQRDDVVVAEKGVFLVNGRFRLSPEELLLRANKMRARQGMPLFQRMPLGFPQERRLESMISNAAE